MDISFLKKVGFSDKSAVVYMALLQLGPSSVRNLADFCSLNRGTTYDSLKWLQERGLVSFYKPGGKQHFVVENPEKLLEMVSSEGEELERAGRQIEKSLPELLALYHRGDNRPVARYFGRSELHSILEDVLATCEASGEMLYRTYSPVGGREFLYENFPTFSDVRVGKGISVRVLALGEGGELRGLDERKWLSVPVTTPTYIIIYPGKTAYVSQNAHGEPVGVVIENIGVAETQKQIFDELWQRLT